MMPVIPDPTMATSTARSPRSGAYDCPGAVREARAVAKLNHPNIAAVYDVVESGAEAHIVMEYVPGETLAQVIGR